MYIIYKVYIYIYIISRCTSWEPDAVDRHPMHLLDNRCRHIQVAQPELRDIKGTRRSRRRAIGVRGGDRYVCVCIPGLPFLVGAKDDRQGLLTTSGPPKNKLVN